MDYGRRPRIPRRTNGIIVSQLISDIVDSVLGNIGTVISLRQSHGKCVRQAGIALNLERWQTPAIAELPKRHAIARFSRYGQPIYLVIKEANELASAGQVSVEEAREMSRQALDNIPYVKQVKEEKKEEDAQSSEKNWRDRVTGLPTRTRLVYARICERPWELIADRMGALGIDRETEGNARDELEALGLIRFAGKVGSRCRLFELTERGKEVAEKWA
jgi:hypothetical protein